MIKKKHHELRWNNYFMRSGKNFDLFWESYLTNKRKLLIILGHGFDSRMCECVEKILLKHPTENADAIVINYDEGPDSPSQLYSKQREENILRLRGLINSRGTITTKHVVMFSEDRRRMGPRSISNEFNDYRIFVNYSDIIVDISALPRGLYFPLLSKILSLFDNEAERFQNANLHVVVSHSVEIDNKIQDEGIDEVAGYLHGFAAASLDTEATKHLPRIWIPLLGKSQIIQFNKIYELVQPDEICPLLPSPALNPRSADDLILEYQNVLFEQLRVEPQNFIYAAETNPFEVYRQIMNSILHYRDALSPIGGCKAVISAMSTKLLSLGALLAAYELSHNLSRSDKIDVGMGHIDTQGYHIEDYKANMIKSVCYTFWLTGECYNLEETDKCV